MSANGDSIVGDLINFRGIVYAPVNEQGVVFLFGRVTEDLNMYVEEIKTGFPDCIARRFIGTGWKRVRIEFEYHSINFRDHKHDPTGCDIIVCWQHDWPECPLEVIELREAIKGLENRPIEPPGTGKANKGLTVKQWFRKHGMAPGQERLFERIVETLQEANEQVFYKVGATAISVYCPERVMVYAYPRKDGIHLQVFKGTEPLGKFRTVKSRGRTSNWGTLTIKDESSLDEAESRPFWRGQHGLSA